MKLKTFELLLHVMELKAFELFLDLIRSPGAASRDLVVLVPFFAIIVFEDFENCLFVYGWHFLRIQNISIFKISPLLLHYSVILFLDGHQLT